MNVLLLVGIVLLAGFGGGRLSDRIGLPSVTGYLFTGLIIGPTMLGIISPSGLNNLQPINNFALGLIGLSIGGELKWRFIKTKWQDFSLLFLGELIITFSLVFISVYLYTDNLAMAAVLASLALATAPGAIINIINENNVKGSFPKILMSLVAIDNLFCIIIFSITVTFLNIYYFGNTLNRNIFTQLSYEIGLSLLIGVILGVIGLIILNNIQNKNQQKILFTGLIFIAIGLPLQLNLQFLIVTLINGIIIVNFSPYFRRFYDVLHTIDTPVLVLFLTLAGARLDIVGFITVGLLGLIYIIARISGKVLGLQIGSKLCAFLPDSCHQIPPKIRKYLGLALLPGAGVAIGLSILAEERLPLPENTLVTIILGSVIFFEFFGSVMVKKALDLTDSIN
ncbi:MAG: cation:proton antiporter [Bacillota bacterium]